MEDTFSLGNVLLYGEFPGKGKENSLTGEMAELFISKIFGVTVLKLMSYIQFKPQITVKFIGHKP